MPSAGSRTDLRLVLAVLAVAVLALGLHAYRYMPFICDDALISLRYAKRLLDGQGLTWNSGERVEGYSNLLWVLSSAALGWLGFDLITSVRILGVAGMVLTMAAVLYAFPPSSLSAVPVTGIALLFLALSSAFAVWAIGGMEQPLVAALLAWAVVLCFPHLESRHVSFRQLQWPGLCLALLCLTRPDAPLFTAAAVLAMVVVGGGRRDAFEKGIALATLPVLFFLGQLTFRLFYYGEWVPNTALVKFNPSGRYALDGWRYVGAGALAISPMLALAVAAAALSFRRGFQRGRMTLLCVLALTWVAYVVVIGGDIFPAWRHFVPLLVLLALMIAIGGEWIHRHARPRVYAGVAVVAALLLGAFSILQWRDTMAAWALTERWEWDGQIIGRMLKKAFGAQAGPSGRRRGGRPAILVRVARRRHAGPERLLPPPASSRRPEDDRHRARPWGRAVCARPCTRPRGLWHRDGRGPGVLPERARDAGRSRGFPASTLSSPSKGPSPTGSRRRSGSGGTATGSASRTRATRSQCPDS